MLNKTYMFKAVGNDKSNLEFVEISPKDEDSFGLVVLDVNSHGFFIYQKSTKTFEKIVSLKREDTEITREKFKNAHKLSERVDKAFIDEYFPVSFSYFLKKDKLCGEYFLEYDEAMLSKYFATVYAFSTTLNGEKSFTVELEDSRIVTVDATTLKKTNILENSVDKFIVTLKNEILDVIMFEECYSNVSNALKTEHTSRMMSFNLKTGMSYLHPVKKDGIIYGKVQNATTGNRYELGDVPNIVVDKIIGIIKEYNEEKYGTKISFVEYKYSIDTIRSLNFNPLCNIMYSYKSFFNTRFRTYFKRDDTSINHFVLMCNMLNVPYTDEYLELCAVKPNNIFLAKCLFDAGITKPENIVTMIKSIGIDLNITEMYVFIDKYYGENTDYLFNDAGSKKTRNIREDLCKYISKALTFSSEDEFVSMFCRSVAQHNKYWRRSISQVATLLDFNDFNRELMRKACCYGLNKIQSDNIDLAYDKVITKNKFLIYSEKESQLECEIGKFSFKLPLDMSEVNDMSFEIIDERTSKANSFETMRKFYNIIFVKDSYGEILAYLKFRKGMLLEAKINSSSPNCDDDEVKEACRKWCDANEIKRYRCKDLECDDVLWMPF